MNTHIILDSIYNSLDNGKFQQAIKICQKPEVCNLVLVKTLKSYAHACIGERDESLKLARQVSATKPLEESIIGALGCAFKVCGEEKEFSECYEYAISQRNYQEQFYFELFYSYARQNEPKKMQQLSQKFYKLFNKTHFLYWSVTCMMLQDDLPSTLYLLAEKTMSKSINDLRKNFRPSGEEMSLYSYLLMKQGKPDVALSSLNEMKNRTKGEPLIDEDHFKANVNLVPMDDMQFSMHQIDLLARAGNIDQLLQKSLEFLEIYPDQYDVHHLIINLVVYIDLMDSKKLSEIEGIHNQTNENLSAFDFPTCTHDAKKIFKLIDPDSLFSLKAKYSTSGHQKFLLALQKSHPKLRGPFLAEIQLLLRWVFVKIELENSESICDKLPIGWDISKNEFDFNNVIMPEELHDSFIAQILALLASYLKKFNKKQCCFSDIRPFVNAIKSIPNPSSHNALLWLKLWSQMELKGIESSLIDHLINVCQMKDITKSLENENEPEKDESEYHNQEKSNEKGKSSSKNKKKKNSKKQKGGKAIVTKEQPLKSASYIDTEKLGSIVHENQDLIVELCAFSKFDQVASFCDFLISNKVGESNLEDSDEDSGDIVKRIDIYKLSKKVFIKGVGGEERTLLPGDELLLVNSSFLRQKYADSFRKNSILMDENSFDVIIKPAIEWMIHMNNAMKWSPFNHCFKLDSLEPMRILGLSESSFDTFHDLKVRNMQFDSMLYLIIPVLFENGFYQEVSKLNKQLIRFHQSAQKDGLDMMGRSFEFGNYMKAIELKNFTLRCKRSLQLALSNCELPIVELIYSQMDFKGSIDYLKDYYESNESFFNQVIDIGTENLVDHLDYDIVIRTDGFKDHYNDFTLAIDKNSSSFLPNKRRAEIEKRIRFNINQLKFLYSLSCRDYKVSIDSLSNMAIYSNLYVEKFLISKESIEDILDFMNKIINAPLCSEKNMEDSLEYRQWDQGISVQNFTYPANETDLNFESIVLKASFLSNFAIVIDMFVNEQIEKIPVLNQFEKLDEFFSKLFDMFESIISTLADKTKKFIDLPTSSSTKTPAFQIISPLWIKKISFVVIHLASILPLSLSMQHKFKPQNSKKVNQTPDHFRSFKEILSGIDKQEIEGQKLYMKSAISLIQQTISRLVSSALIDLNQVPKFEKQNVQLLANFIQNSFDKEYPKESSLEISMVKVSLSSLSHASDLEDSYESFKLVANQILSSHSESAKRLREILIDKQTNFLT